MARNVIGHIENDFRQAEATVADLVLGMRRAKEQAENRLETIALIFVVAVAFIALCYAVSR